VSNGLKERFRHANFVLAVAIPLFLVSALLFRHAGEGVLLAIAFVYFAGSLAAAVALNERTERRRQREARDQ
jgi:ABC-type Na+ efflux pump permease subunit